MAAFFFPAWSQSKHTGSFIFNCQHLEATKMSFSKGKINKLRHTQTIEYNLALKRSNLSNYEKTWRKLKYMSISEISQYNKAIYCMVPTICHSIRSKVTETVKRFATITVWER